MNRYFFAHNSNRLIAGVRFEPVDVQGGTVFGVMAASGELATAIGEQAKNPEQTAVWETTELEYFDRLKKKSPSFENSMSSNPRPEPSSPLMGDGAHVVQAPSVHTQEATQTADEAVELALVAPPAPAPALAAPEKRKGPK